MSIGDFTVLEQACLAGRGARTYRVAAGATTIYPGEPVVFGGPTQVTVRAMATSNPIAGSDYFVGIAATTSTQTSGTAGVVGVYPSDSAITWLVSPKTATSWDTQSEYNALVNQNITIDLTSGVYTANASNGTDNGVKVMPLDIIEHPGKVAVAFRDGASALR